MSESIAVPPRRAGDGRRPLMCCDAPEYRTWLAANPEGFVHVAGVIHRSTCTAVLPTDGPAGSSREVAVCSGDAPPLEVLSMWVEGAIVRCALCRPASVLHADLWGGQDVWR